MVNVLTVIPARSGSKSIPKKNIKMINEHPMMAYSVVYSMESDLVDKTVVSTDSEEFAVIARKYNAEVPFLRPSELAEDSVQDFPVIEHALKECERIYGKEFELVVWLRPTSPVRPKRLIERGVELMMKHPEASSLRSVVRCSEHPYRQWLSNGLFMKGLFPELGESYNLPRQQLPTVYFQSGDIEIVRRSTILDGSISGDKVIPLILEKEEMVDIDNYSDLNKAEKVLRGSEK